MLRSSKMSSSSDVMTRRFARAADTEDPLAVEQAEARAAARLFGDSTPAPDKLGERYTILERLGSGGGGVVYAARDHQLEREVAIKVLRSADVDDRAQARLAREARTLAQLSHPNVVTVFDLGTSDGRLYVAMERMRGVDLREWLAARKRAPREILDAFASAGRGLAAAHALKVVHRDFKPSNVMVAEDGTIKVLDFGLARGFGAARPDRTDHPPEADTVTDADAAMGTLRYMAPEQHSGATVDERTDVYAFCASLYEALLGPLGWEGLDWKRTVELKQAGPPDVKRAPGIPKRVRSLLRRGLSPTPSERPASMTEVVDALGARPRWIGPAVVAMGGIAVFAVAVSQQSDEVFDPCAGLDEPITALWNDEVAEDLERRLVESTDDGLEVSAALRERLDRWTTAWSQMRRQSCEDTRVHTVQSEAMQDRREACLDERRVELRQLLATLAGTPEDLRDRVLIAPDALSPVALCDTAMVAMREGDGPLDPKLDEALAEVGVLNRMDERAEAKAKLAAIFEMLRERPEPHRRARALLHQAQHLKSEASIAAAIQALEQATMAAAATDDRPLRLRAWSALAYLDTERNELERAEHYLGIAQSLAESIDGPCPERILLATSETQLHITAGRFEDALVSGKRSVELAKETPSKEGQLAMAQTNLGLVYGKLERFEEAKPLFAEALAYYESRTGSRSPDAILLLNNLGAADRALGNPEGARARYERALRLAETYLPADHHARSQALENLARLELADGNLERAEELLEVALGIDERLFGVDNRQLVPTLLSLGRSRARPDDNEGAIAAYERALAILDATVEGDPQHRIVAEFRLAHALYDGEPARARALATQALARVSDPESDDADTIRKWLDEHPPG